MNTELIQRLNDELELLTSMVRAERITATPENQQFTDEQAERTHKALDACLALAGQAHPKGYVMSRVVEYDEWPAPHSPVGGEEPVFTETQVKAMVEDITVIAARNAQKCYTARIEQMTPPAPVAFHIDNYMWKNHGIKLT